MDQSERMLESDRLRGLTIACPECGTTIQSTGKMYYSPVIKDWLIEYWCPVDQEFLTIYTPETARLARETAGDHDD
jgi:hypothetical protein